LAVVAVDGRSAATHAFGGELGDPYNVTTVVLADGTPALIWLDHFARNDYRMRLAAEGAEPRDPALPRVKVRLPTNRRIRDRTRLHLPVECSGPCELHARMTGAAYGDGWFESKAPGKGTLVIYAFSSEKPDRRSRGSDEFRGRSSLEAA
jgi:hypothetical protein